ncbi:MAG: hypothetical protein AB1545_00895 [Thermodesulfobacteriota bacterium]
MPHTMNRRAFLSARHSDQPLLAAYGQLVATELALKDHHHSAGWPKGHDVPGLLGDLGDPGLTALGAQLRAELSAIPCTDTSGNTATVRPHKYPELRYTQHENDHTGGTTDANLLNLVKVVEDIIVQLRAKGVAI